LFLFLSVNISIYGSERKILCIDTHLKEIGKKEAEW
jgi:hypothetical protein